MKTNLKNLAGAIVALFAMVACSEMTVYQTPCCLQFDFQVEAPSMTRSPRNSWLEGDKMILFFNKKVADNQQAELIYDGTEWKIKFQNPAYMASLPETGIIDAIYFEGGDMKMNTTAEGISKLTSLCQNKIRLQAEEVPYTRTGKVVEAVLPMKYYDSFVMLTVKGVEAADDWTFYAEPSGGVYEVPFNHVPGTYLNQQRIGSISSEAINRNQPIRLLENPEGASCYMEIWDDPEGYQGVEEYTFHLFKGKTEYLKTFHHRIQAPCEIVLDGPVAGNLNGWILVENR